MSATIEVNGATVAYTAAGTGEPVVLLHSSASSGAQWRALGEQLDDRFLVLAPDLYGYGGTDPWPGRGPLTLADEAALVAAVVAGRAGPFHLVGHSYGGAVALRIAVDHPERLRSLTLIEPVAFHVLRNRGAADRALFAEVCGIADAVSAAALSGDYAGGMERFVDYWNGAGTWARIRPESRAAMCRSATKVPLDFWATTTEQTSLDAYRRVRVPTLVLCGDRSPAPTRRIAGLLAARLPAARLDVVAGAGHMLPLTHRDAVNAAIAGHLARAGGDATRRRRAA
ncbi:MAG TPA: alpha/beta hydrolase [Geminicoccaceae bacterium]|nr:alpha/beta hydrolase [Geminicoccaceae bacterium]